jgi:RNA polymerase sigma-70 factor (ECF subfamily)
MSVTLAQMTASLRASPAQPMPDTSIDAETTKLALLAKGGDAEAFCALIELHRRAARRVATVALGDSPEVEEAVQDACIAAWRRVTSLEDPTAFRAWLLRITWRKSLDRRRSVRALLKRVVDVIDGTVDQSPGADRLLLDDERDRIVAQMIRSLPARLRDPFLLAASGEHRYEEIAVMLRIPAGTVKWRVSEAKRMLREKLTRVGF